MTYDGSIKIDTKIDNHNAEDGVKKLEGIVTKGMAAIGAAVVAGMGAATKVGMDFEASMSQVAATMGMTSEEIRKGSKDYEMLAEAAEKCGAETKYSASEAAEALNYLALAGYDAKKSAAALPKVLDLAAAGNIELGYASDLVTDSMSALSLETEQLDSFIDQMAKTSQKSNTNVAQLGEAILTVGGTAKSLAGGTVELNTQLGILADNGIKGSEGGTALRNIILAMTPTTKAAREGFKKLNVETYDAQGNLRPLNDIFADMNKSLANLSEEEKTRVLNDIFNKVDLKSANALLGTSAERFEDLANQIENSSGAAANMAETMNDNLKGQLDELSSALEGLGIKVYEDLEEPLKEAVKTGIREVNKLTDAVEEGKLAEAIQDIGFAAQTVGPGIIVFTGIMQGYTAATKLATVAQTALNAAMDLNPVVLATAGLAGLTLAGFNLIMSNNNVTESAYKQSEAYIELCDRVEKQKAAYDELAEASQAQLKNDLAQIDYVEDLYNELETLADETGKVEDADRSRASFIIEQINNIIPNALEMVDGQIKKNQDLKQSIQDVINAEKAKIILSANEVAYKEAVKNVADAQAAQAQTANQLAIEQERLNELMKEQEERLAKGQSASLKLNEEINPLKESIAKLTEELATQTTTLDEYYADIQRYESDYAAVQSGNAEQIQAVINRTTDSYKNEALALAESVSEKKDILARSVIDAETQYALLMEKFKAGEGGITQAQVDAAKERANKALEDFKAVGGNLVDGIIVGVDEKSIYLNASMTRIIERAIQAAKDAGDINSPSRDMRDEVGAMLAEGVAVGIKEHTDSVVDAAEDMTEKAISSAERYNSEYARIQAKRAAQDKADSEAQYRERLKKAKSAEEQEKIKQERLLELEKEGDDAYLAQLKETAEKEKEEREKDFKELKNNLDDELITKEQYYNKLGVLRDKYFAEDSEEWQEYSRDIANYQKELLEDYTDTIEKLWSNTEDKLSGYGELFTRITATYKGMGEHGTDFVITRGELADLDEQTKLLTEYADTLIAVKERGELPEGFFEELKEMSIEDGLLYAKTLLDASDEEFSAYLESYRQKQEEIARITRVLNQDEMNAAIADMTVKLKEVYGEVPEDFFNCGGESAEEFADGFIQKLPEMFEAMRTELARGFAQFAPILSLAGGGSIGGGNTYTSSYNFYSSGQTVSEQLASARAYSTVQRLRGEN